MSALRAAVAARPGRSAERVEGSSPRGERAPRSRPRLELIERPRWWRRVPWGVVAAVVVFVACLFGALFTHVSLIGGQERLDELQADISEARHHREELRRQESQLQGPDEVRRIAVEEYGMVDAASAEAVAPLPRTIHPLALPVADPLAPEG